MSTDKAPNPSDSLGDRIKRYERASRPFLSPNTPVMIRVDGKAFHTFTKHMDKPFDHRLIEAMQTATSAVSERMQGFRLAYTQSDEASFLLTDTDRLESQPWMDNNTNKIVSVTASMFTYFFNSAMNAGGPGARFAPAFFDARAFNIPAEDAANAFIWRQRDWERNSLQMVGHYMLGHSRMQNLKNSQVHEKLHDLGLNWAHLERVQKNGTFVDYKRDYICDKLDYTQIQKLIEAASPLEAT